MTLPWGNPLAKRKAWLLTGIIGCKWPRSHCTATNLFLMLNMIWLSYMYRRFLLTWYRDLGGKSQKRHDSNNFFRNRITILSRRPVKWSHDDATTPETQTDETNLKLAANFCSNGNNKYRGLMKIRENQINVWVKKTETNCSIVSLLHLSLFFWLRRYI